MSTRDARSNCCQAPVHVSGDDGSRMYICNKCQKPCDLYAIDMRDLLLTDDEKLTHKPRWQGETQDFPTAIRSLAKVHRLADQEIIEDSEDWEDFINELAVIVQQLGAR